LKAILDPVISEVVKLVLGQIDATNATVKSVLLVGGFSGSKYLQERIRGAVKQGIEVINPPYAWSAVVQGAVVKGLAHYDPMHATVRLSSRIARKHFGTQVGYPFDEETDLPEKK
jgi:molecular chaperone DnaK (HSP70)